MKATKAIILARVSTEEQAKDNHFSIPAQLRNLREYCEKKGLKIVGEYQFDESASKDKRKKFEEAIKVVEHSKEAIAIVADKVDRFQRGWRETVRFDELRKQGKVELHFASQGLLIHRNSQPYDVLQLSANVRRSIKEKLKQGRFPGGLTPVGYKNVQVEVAPGKFVKKIELDPAKAKFVKKCFELYATGKFSVKGLAEMMAKAGFTSKTRRTRVNGELVERGAKPVTEGDILVILKNPFYFGKFYYKNPDTGERELYNSNGSYPVLIKDWKLFEKVQKILDGNNSRKNGYKKNNFKFRKLITCGFCGAVLTVEEMSRCYKDKNSPKAKSSIYYHCSSARAINDSDWYKRKYGTDHSGAYVANKGKHKGQKVIACPQKWWKEEEIEKQILDAFDQINYGEEVYAWLRTKLEKEYEERADILEKNIKATRVKLSQNQEIMRSLVRSIAVESNESIKQDMRQEYKKLKKEQDSLKEELKFLEESLQTDSDEVIKSLKFCSNLKDEYLRQDLEGKRELLFTVFSKIEAWKGEWRINRGKGKKIKTEILHFTWNEPFATLKSINIEELAKSETRVPRLSITKIKQTKASLFP